ncbi:MAG: flagellar hook assembly protein FlgD [Beijerinckiaceae bacterium]|jgi:flagellar basal-body rod modification protein FlgD|nr:flagellar hook assembly protein FlgD [Beijerinckiaceae bacterium]
MTTVSNVTSTPASSSTSNPAARIADNFDQFLQLLTTQLKNQSPLDPLDTNQFTQQLVQFASVEQQIKTNDNLTSLLTANKTANLTNALGFVGANVTADGTTTALQNGKATWQINAPKTGSATITIKDKSGNEVYAAQKVITAGDQSFVWDGRTTSGTNAPAGQYTIVVAARDAAGQAMSIKSEITGTVDNVDVTSEVPVLKIGDIGVPMTSVKSIRR